MSDILSKRPSIFEKHINEEPDYHPWCDQYIEAIQDSFWTHRLYTFQSDIQDFKVKLSEKERQIILRNLSLIAQIENAVKSFWAKVGDNLPHSNIINMGYVLASNEVVHGKAYKNLPKVLGVQKSIDEILQYDIIQNRVNYLTKHIRKFHSDNKKQFVYSLILFTLIIENLSLFASFYTVSWFNRVKDVLKDTNKQVMYTSREETIHSEVGIRLFLEIKKDHPELFDDELKEKVLKESEEFLAHELKIMTWALGDFNESGDDGEVLNVEVLYEMLKERHNVSLEKIGYGKIFEVDKEQLEKTKWFDRQLISPIRTDFFQERPSEYGVGSTGFEEDDLFND